MSVSAFLSENRKNARAAFGSAPLPPRWGHAWRYSDPKMFLPSTAIPREGTLREFPSPVPAGVSITRFADALGEDARAIEEFLGTAAGIADGKMEAFGLAEWQDALLVRIAPGASPEGSIHLRTRPGPGSFGAVRLLVVAGEGSMAHIVDDYQGGTAAPFLLHSGVELVAGPSSCIRYTAVQELGASTVFHLKERARAMADSSVFSSAFAFGASMARTDLGTILEGRNASSSAFGVTVGSASQHFDLHTVHLHRAPGTRSDFDFRSILAGQARSIYTGSIIIEKDAPGCEAYQINRNLMLSDGARADSIPELEIKNDDVRCSHGSATGPVEPSQVYYLMARGLPEPEALRIVAAGFAEQLFARIPTDLSARAHAQLAARLEAI
jgi:Fe-S cluster assembly protein SufD